MVGFASAMPLALGPASIHAFSAACCIALLSLHGQNTRHVQWSNRAGVTPQRGLGARNRKLFGITRLSPLPDRLYSMLLWMLYIMLGAGDRIPTHVHLLATAPARGRRPCSVRRTFFLFHTLFYHAASPTLELAAWCTKTSSAATYFDSGQLFIGLWRRKLVRISWSLCI